MLLPESKAKERVCPLMSKGSETVKCMGSSCMAWRFNEKHKYPQKEQTGYCGISGRPEPNPKEYEPWW